MGRFLDIGCLLIAKHRPDAARHISRAPRGRIRSDQNRWMMPTPAANWLGDDDGALWKPSPILAVALMMLPAPAVPSVLPFAR